jgi:hypothetical protein
MLRRSRFRDLVARQLELFAEDERALLAEAAAADEAWTQASREDAEERYGDYQVVADVVAERLYDLREAYAAGLGDDAAARYRAEFDSMARKRFRRFAGLLGG